ncbi:MAG TPA: S41 family peptidase, partial [Ignavibacteriaceae bacterium]|nr:S41 family peptidase [Ignavibacteriaceae bacterium]
MEKILILTLLFFNSISSLIYSQDNTGNNVERDKPVLFIPNNHQQNFERLNKVSAKSFYKSKLKWQHIIDSTWGPGDPLAQKLLIFNTYAKAVHDEFDGFNALKLNRDSLYNFYLNKINDSTSRGAFSAIMSRFAYSLKDLHTKAYDSTVVLTSLNSGVPLLLIGSYFSVEHFGAVTTVLPDSTTLVLRVVPNHPLGLQPGDIILGYEGKPWKYLVKELIASDLPMVAYTGGCKSSDTYLNLSGAGMNWHLFDTIDILKYSTGDTLHLSVLPLQNLNVPPMANNEQLAIPNIPFPDVINDDCATYGFLENSNIGYIFLGQEYPTANAEIQFYEAVNALKNTDALIIDMRLNYGGWAQFNDAFQILFNESLNTLADAYRCSSNTYDLCPAKNYFDYFIDGKPPKFYDSPIAVLLGPTCVSDGDITAQRLRYHPMVKFFGKSPDASLGFNKFITDFPGWFLRLSIADVFHVSKPGVYLNKREFPVDFPVWHNRDDVAKGKDAVVERALDWIKNLVYSHNLTEDKTFYHAGIDTLRISTLIENPNAHQTASSVYLNNSEGNLVDSL